MSDTSPITYTKVTDFASADDFAKKHTPYITSQRSGDLVTVSVEVGHEIPHPNQADHFIMYVELFAFEVPIARFEFAPAVSNPRVNVECMLPAGTKISAIEHCNLHGVWLYEAVV